jgi:hypothetical protein
MLLLIGLFLHFVIKYLHSVGNAMRIYKKMSYIL